MTQYGKRTVMNGGVKVVDLWAEQPDPMDMVGGRDAVAPDAAPDVVQALPAVPPLPRAWGRDLIMALALMWLALAITVILVPRLLTPLDPAMLGHIVTLGAPALIILAGLGLTANTARASNRAEMVTMMEKIRQERHALTLLINDTEARFEASAHALQAQTSSIEALSESTLKRIATLRATLDEEIGQIGVQTNALKNAAAAARSDMAVLMANLPKAQVETRKIVTALQDAGVGAYEQAVALSQQAAALVAVGTDAQQASEVASQTLGARIEDMSGHVARMRTLVDDHEARLARVGSTGTGQIERRMERLGRDLDHLAEKLGAHDQLGGKLLSGLQAGLADVEARLASIDTHGTARTAELSDTLVKLTGDIAALETALAGGSQQADKLIGRAEGLVTVLNAAHHDLADRLPAPLAAVEAGAQAVHDSIRAAATETATLRDAVESTRTGMSAQLAMVHDLGTALDRCKTQVEAVHTDLAAQDATMTRMADGASVALIDALVRVRETAQQASIRAREALEQAIPDAAGKLGAASETAVRTALSGQIEAQIAQIASVARDAVESADRATDRLMRQMLTISEASAAFRKDMEEAEAQVDTSIQTVLSRRVALLIESLNSISIDVTKILATEVTDAAWTSYLKGDRGIFTRRAVRLLDGAMSRDILRHYDSDSAFREHVNRYIHDFEAMMRQVLGARDNGPLTITLLSSDMGKLYVALAQAIERLRA